MALSLISTSSSEQLARLPHLFRHSIANARTQGASDQSAIGVPVRTPENPRTWTYRAGEAAAPWGDVAPGGSDRLRLPGDGGLAAYDRLDPSRDADDTAEADHPSGASRHRESGGKGRWSGISGSQVGVRRPHFRITTLRAYGVNPSISRATLSRHPPCISRVHRDPAGVKGRRKRAEEPDMVAVRAGSRHGARLAQRSRRGWASRLRLSWPSRRPPTPWTTCRAGRTPTGG